MKTGHLPIPSTASNARLAAADHPYGVPRAPSDQCWPRPRSGLQLLLSSACYRNPSWVSDGGPVPSIHSLYVGRRTSPRAGIRVGDSLSPTRTPRPRQGPNGPPRCLLVRPPGGRQLASGSNTPVLRDPLSCSPVSNQMSGGRFTLKRKRPVVTTVHDSSPP